MRGKSSNIYQKRLILIYMLCLIMIVGPLILYTNAVVKPNNIKQANRQTLGLIESKANEMGAWLDQRISEIRVINSFFKVGGMDFEAIKPYITNINDLVRDSYGNPQESYAIGGTDGLGWINDQLTINISQREYFKEAMVTDNEYVIGSPVVSKSDNEPIFLICYPIKDENNQTIGFINGSINLQYFTDIIEQINVYDGLVWIMNRDAEIYTKAEEVKQKFDDHLQTIAEYAKNENGSLTVNVDGKKVTVFYAAVPYAENLILCDAIYAENIAAPTTKIVNNLLLCAAIASFVIWLASFLLAEKLADENRRLIDEVSVIYERERKAQIRALQAQINPHFLYNTLDTIQWKALDYNAFDIAEMIQKLSMIFRISLSDGKEEIPVEQEIKHVQSYLDIQKIRYKDQFWYTIEVDEKVKSMFIPKLIIQPLVENSIYHGIKGMQKMGAIDISVYLDKDRIVVSVKDNGKGMTDAGLNELRNNLVTHTESDHYGLYNIYEKLHLTYGDAFELNMMNQEGFHVMLSFPSQIGGKHHVESNFSR